MVALLSWMRSSVLTPHCACSPWPCNALWSFLEFGRFPNYCSRQSENPLCQGGEHPFVQQKTHSFSTHLMDVQPLPPLEQIQVWAFFGTKCREAV
ncbi:hypothetical protein GOP47_0022831 [Adiantum capillus-veneris]|uniref:Secreted protein n=1 Tax=Adiantum capillus-veneris TaxID=13818 RepID=A0A9D4U785_ADICA|nr:hypothetical protein GOP47_0022831 [Adiantum capillus-veneris]